MKILVSNLYTIDYDNNAFNPTHVISMLDPKIKKKHIPQFSSKASVLQLFFYDDDDVDLQQTPIENHLIKIISFLDNIVKLNNKKIRLLVHCHAGASRSTAVVYILQYMLLKDENLAFKRLLETTKKPWPNRQLINLADKHFQTKGSLLKPLEDYRAIYPKRYLAYMRLNRLRRLEQFIE